MPKELVISAAPHETRVAILEDGLLCEIYIEREKEFALVGSIYKGRVTRVLPGMQSAFVDIGRDTDAFLYVSDFLENLEEYDSDGKGDDRPHKPAPRNGGNGGNGAVAVEAPVVEQTSAPHHIETLPGEHIALASGDSPTELSAASAPPGLSEAGAPHAIDETEP